MSIKHKPCLVLNADYTPISIIDWRSAIHWYFKIQEQKYPVIDIIEFYKNDGIKGCNTIYQVPAIIRVNKYIKSNKNIVKFSRKNLFLRDNYTCQYCKQRFAMNKLTYDHVIPKSKWSNTESPTSWNNIVTACHICNRRKADKTPQQANMKLLPHPQQPKFSFKYLHWYESLLNIGYVQEWAMYIPKELKYEDKYVRVQHKAPQY